jgi:MFS family permease
MKSVLAPSALAFLSHTAVMVLELVAGRLAARNVGSSNYTWIGIICVILAGMSLGNRIGGKLADRYRPVALLPILFAVAAALTLATLPLNTSVGALKGALLPIVVENPSSSNHLWGWSVVLMMTIVFLAPAVALGVISPVISKWAIERSSASARALGAVHAASALGAVVGTFLTGFVLVSALGVTAIVASVAATLAALGALLAIAMFRERRAVASTMGPPRAPSPDPHRAATEEPPLRSWIPPVAAFFAGAFLMAIEMVASRLVSRALGSSLYSWTGVIGVIFVGMCIGNYLGGHLATRRRAAFVVVPMCIVASIASLSIVWTQNVLSHVQSESDWPASRHRLDAHIVLPRSALPLLEAKGLAADDSRALAPIVDAPFDSEAVFVGRVAEVLGGAAAPPHRVSLVRSGATLRGAGARRLREAGHDEERLRLLFPLVDEAAQAKEPFSKRVLALLGSEHDSWSDTVCDALVTRGAWPYPLRLLIALAIAFLAPAIAMGALSPVFAQLAIERGGGAGNAVGRVYAYGAWGSIVGTFLSGFYLFSSLGVFGVVAMVTMGLALMAMGFAGALRRTGRWALAWLLFAVVCTLPIFHQQREPNAFDPPAPPRENAGTLATVWDSLPRLIGDTLQVRDSVLGSDVGESDYQYLAVETADRRALDSPGGDLRTLTLDNLVHGYVGYEMPDDHEGEEFSFAHARHDPSAFEYGYMGVKAVMTARFVKDRIRSHADAEGHVTLEPPHLRTLTLGGGAYTLPRYLLGRYPGAKYTVATGDTLRRILEQQYAAGVPSAVADLEPRVRHFNASLAGLALDAPLPPGTSLFLPSLADVAEIDPAVTLVNHTRMKLPRPHEEPRIRTWHYDARNFIEGAERAGWLGRYDVVYGDAVNHYNVPFHLTTRELNESLKKLLAPRGLYLLNVIDEYESLRFVSALAHTLRASFRHVVLFVDKPPTSRYYRSTFVFAASDAPLDASRLGGLSENVLSFVDDNDAEGVEQYLEGDSLGAQALRERMQKEGAKNVSEALVAEKRLDLWSLYLEYEGDWEKAEKRRDPRLAVRDFVALEGDALTARIIEPGLRGSGEVAAAGARLFVLTRTALEYAAIDGVPPALLAPLRPFVGAVWLDADDAALALGPFFSGEDEGQHVPLLLRLCRLSLKARRPPLLLTDDHAPVDELLSPLLHSRE